MRKVIILMRKKIVCAILFLLTVFSTAKLVCATVIKLGWPYQPWPSAMVDIDGDGKADYGIEVNPWNMKSAEGNITMEFDNDTCILKAVCSLQNVQPATWTNGYPEIYVGRKPWNRNYANGLGVEFPIKISDLQSMSVNVSFKVNVSNLYPSINFNIAADAWIVRKIVADNPGRPPSDGDLEIMVWIYRRNLNPAGNKVGEENISGRKWEVWRADRMSGGCQYIAFISSGWEIKDGSISYDIAEFVKTAAKYATFDISTH